MFFFTKKHICFPLHPFLEFLIVTVSLISILVPLRIFLRLVLVDDWIGSIGVISIVFGSLLFLSKKEKLGVFGQMFIRQITRNYTGKKKWVVYSQIMFFLLFGILTIFSIHLGNTEYYVLKEQVIAEFNKKDVMIDSQINYDAIHQISSQLSLEQQLGSIALLPVLIIQHYEIFSVVLAVTDQLMGGWVMYFWQIMVIETIEIMLFLALSRKYLFKNI